MLIKRLKLIEKKNLWFGISGLIIAVGFGLMGVRWFRGESVLNFGTDFVGGSTMVLKFDALNEKYKAVGHTPEFQKESTQFIAEVRSELGKFGLSKSMIQLSQDQEVIIKTVQMSNDKINQVREGLTQRLGPIEVLEIDYVGPSMGAELRRQAIMIVGLVSVALMGYITWRFEFAFGVGALAAALHDALILISVASIFRFEVDTAFVAAMLTILGYSINDTVVIFDRIRDNLIAARKAGRGFDFLSVVNNSIYETFGRTINTVVTVLLVLISLLIFGGGTMRAFVEVLFVGVLVGTYSSIFIASPWMVIAYREPVAPVTEQKSVSAKR